MPTYRLPCLHRQHRLYRDALLRAALTGGYGPIRTLVKKATRGCPRVPFGGSPEVLRSQHLVDIWSRGVTVVYTNTYLGDTVPVECTPKFDVVVVGGWVWVRAVVNPTFQAEIHSYSNCDS
jgi:hypothetical protein